MMFFKSLRWSSIGVLSRYLLQTASMIILSRLLSPLEFGQISALMIIISISLIFSQLGTSQFVSASNLKDLSSRFYQCLIIAFTFSLLISISLYLFSVEISYFFNIEDHKLLEMLIPFILLKSLYSPIEGYFVSINKFDILAKIDVISYFFGYFLISVFFAYSGASSYSLIYANLCQAAIALTFVLFIYCKYYKVNSFFSDFKFNNILNTLYKTSIIGYGQLLSGLSAQVDNFVINKYVGSVELGIYSRAYQLMVVPCNFMGQILNKVIISNFSKALDPEFTHSLLTKGLFLILSMSIITSFMICFFGDSLIGFILGDGWGEVLLPLLILSFTILPRMLYKLCEPILIACKLEVRSALNIKFYFFSMCVLCYTFKSHGIIGISVAVLFSTYLYGIISAYYIQKIYPTIKKMLILSISIHILFCILLWFSL